MAPCPVARQYWKCRTGVRPDAPSAGTQNVVLGRVIDEFYLKPSKAGSAAMPNDEQIKAQLAGQSAWNAQKPPDVFSDTLTFTTKLNAGVTPTLELGAGPGNFKLNKFTIDGSAERQDVHKVTIVISITPQKTIGTARLSSFGSSRTVVVPTERALLPGQDSGTSNVILELDRLRNLDEDRRILENLNLVPLP